MSLARWIILVALLSSIGLGYYGYRLHSQRMELEDALANDVPKLSLELQNLAKRYTVLNKQFERDGLQGQSDPATYIRTIAAGRDVQIGAGAREVREHELGGTSVVGMPWRVHALRNHVAFGAGDRGMRRARLEVNRVRADTGIRAVGRAEQIAGRSRAQDSVAHPRRVAVAGRAPVSVRRRDVVAPPLEATRRERSERRDQDPGGPRSWPASGLTHGSTCTSRRCRCASLSNRADAGCRRRRRP
jgi:hypothetical protein